MMYKDILADTSGRAEAWKCGLLLAGFAFSNPARDIAVYIL
jgi:hypothetical protein